MCEYDCVKTGKILYGESSSTDENEEIYSEELSTYKAYLDILEGEYGHINYSLPAYCIEKKHINCLKELYYLENLCLMWHSGLADISFKEDYLDGLKFVIEIMGDVILDDVNNLRDNCKNYLKELISNNDLDEPVNNAPFLATGKYIKKYNIHLTQNFLNNIYK